MTSGPGTASGEDVFRQLQLIARSDGAGAGKPAPTSEFLTRHGLESFLDRLARTPHAQDFVLKGGILLAVYGVRRPTKDVDTEAVNASVTAAHIERVVRDVAAVAVDDGVLFDVASISVQEIRETAEYPGLRMRVTAAIGHHPISVTWDISTGDPIVPLPTLVSVPRVLGEPIVMLGYAPETVVAEKGVTILERGITSTRWRDYVDIVRLAQEHGLDEDLLMEAAQAVARYRQVALGPVAAVVGYGALGQAKWAAWRRKEGLEDISEADLDDQMVKVSAVLDPVFSRASAAG
jgi:hypothetical protein